MLTKDNSMAGRVISCALLVLVCLSGVGAQTLTPQAEAWLGGASKLTVKVFTKVLMLESRCAPPGSHHQGAVDNQPLPSEPWLPRQWWEGSVGNGWLIHSVVRFWLERRGSRG